MTYYSIYFLLFGFSYVIYFAICACLDILCSLLVCHLSDFFRLFFADHVSSLHLLSKEILSWCHETTSPILELMKALKIALFLLGLFPVKKVIVSCWLLGLWSELLVKKRLHNIILLQILQGILASSFALMQEKQTFFCDRYVRIGVEKIFFWPGLQCGVFAFLWCCQPACKSFVHDLNFEVIDGLEKWFPWKNSFLSGCVHRVLWTYHLLCRPLYKLVQLRYLPF